MGVLVVACLCLLFSFVCTCSFVCCDSAKSRKMYAAAILVGGLGDLAVTQDTPTILALLLKAYWTYEMLKLAKIAEDSTFQKM